MDEATMMALTAAANGFRALADIFPAAASLRVYARQIDDALAAANPPPPEPAPAPAPAQ